MAVLGRERWLKPRSATLANEVASHYLSPYLELQGKSALVQDWD